MTTTDEKRREAARKLREIRPCKSGHIEWWKIAQALGLKEPAGWFGWEKFEPDSVKRLADLVEPEPERKAKAKPFPVEKDTGFFDTTKCECGYLNDVSAKYCGQCGGVIEVIHYAD